jgi:hypothetical protein
MSSGSSRIFAARKARRVRARPAGSVWQRCTTTSASTLAQCDVLREANALVRRDQAWSRDSWGTWVAARSREQGGAGHDAGPRLQTPADWTPIFVVGLPRSGTTLAAVQLARHAGVRDRGELPHIPYIADRLEASGRARDPEALREAAQLYSAHLRQDDAPAPWYVDNNQMNFRHLDLIARLFPRARVIHCVRNRRDTALSIWSQYFANSACAFANDLDDIAAFCAGHDRLMRHWKDSLDLPIHTLVYEDMVEHGEEVGERLRAFVGLPDKASTRERRRRARSSRRQACGRRASRSTARRSAAGGRTLRSCPNSSGCFRTATVLPGNRRSRPGTASIAALRLALRPQRASSRGISIHRHSAD